MAFPSKLTSYFPAGRPILAAVARDSDAALEVQAANAGVVVEPDDPEALARALHDLRQDGGASAALGSAGHRYASVELTPARVLAGYEEYLDLLANGADR
jgi:glycosyltransferase involved in cell wall biosynthesis